MGLPNKNQKEIKKLNKEENKIKAKLAYFNKNLKTSLKIKFHNVIYFLNFLKIGNIIESMKIINIFIMI